jgi:Family of unknown function (DUF6256)
MHDLRYAVIPILAAYALLAAVFVYGVRHPEGEPRSSAAGAPTGWRARVRLIAITVGGGYVAFLTIVLVFHTLIAGQKGAFRSALKGGTFLALTCAVVFTLASSLEARRAKG